MLLVGQVCDKQQTGEESHFAPLVLPQYFAPEIPPIIVSELFNSETTILLRFNFVDNLIFFINKILILFKIKLSPKIKSDFSNWVLQFIK